jgi:hypothetical protein
METEEIFKTQKISRLLIKVDTYLKYLKYFERIALTSKVGARRQTQIKIVRSVFLISFQVRIGQLIKFKQKII